MAVSSISRIRRVILGLTACASLFGFTLRPQTPMKTPVVFVTHGGGPLPVLGDPSHAPLTKHLQELASMVASKAAPPTAIVVISAHWEAGPDVRVSTAANPEMIYDYGGFPAESYKLKYPAKGSPDLARRIQELLTLAGIRNRADPQRGFDHGVFVPLMLAYPAADLPVVSVSLDSSLDPQRHLDIGRAIAPLRDENVLIFGSGASWHNLRAIFSGSPQCMEWSVAFDKWLVDAVTGKRSAGERMSMLAEWEKAPRARQAHPREDHLLPLLVAAGAAEGDPGHLLAGCDIMGHRVSSFMFSR